MEIKRSPEKDAVCRRTCTGFENMHSSHCPYTQERWHMQGWTTYSQFKIPTSKEVRESKAA